MELSSLLPLALYGAIFGAYFVVVPIILMLYFKARWYKTGAWERAFLCFTVFFFFPGLLVVSPFFNFRPQVRSLG
jgi:NAD(P)H-quinone oxidoreductase subunit L